MENKSGDADRIRHQFDAFCRKIIRDERTAYRKLRKKRGSHEVSLSGMADTRPEISVTDTYPSEHRRFVAANQEIFIQNDRLADLLENLPKEKRDAVLLAHCLGMRDQEIAKALKAPRSTVNYRKTTALNTLKEGMEEGEANGGNNEGNR